MTEKTHLTKEISVWINGRFLSRPVTGVERVAHEVIESIATEHLDSQGCWSDGTHHFKFNLIAPKSVTVESPWQNVPLVKRGSLRGHAWEQIELPWLTRNDLLISLCNTGPLFKSAHTVFLHDAQPFAVPGNFSLQFRLWYKILFNVVSRRAKRVLVNSKFTLSELEKYVHLDSEKADLCYLGTEHVSRIHVAKNELARFDLPKEKFVLAVSSVNRNKNFAAVVEALDILGADAPPCVIVGRRDQSHFGTCSLNPEKVTHLGYVSDNELLALYQRALCLAFPSFYEGFGLPPLEAMAVGCPVIVSGTTAMKEIAGTDMEFCNPAEPKSLADAISRISQFPEYRADLIKKGRSRASLFSWSDSGQVVLDSLSKLVRWSYTAAGVIPNQD